MNLICPTYRCLIQTNGSRLNIMGAINRWELSDLIAYKKMLEDKLETLYSFKAYRQPLKPYYLRRRYILRSASKNYRLRCVYIELVWWDYQATAKSE